MTHQEAFDTLDFVLDKSQAPAQDGFGREYLLFNGTLEWLKLHYKDFEKTEKRRQDLDLILVKKSTFGNLRFINLNTVNKFFLTLALSGKWNFLCKTKITLRELPIEPATHDEIKTIANDPFNCPTDAFPRYTQFNDGVNPVIEIHSDNLPQSVEMVYLEVPEKILDSTPLATCQLPDWAMHEIIQHSARHALGILENFQRYQAQSTVEIPTHN